MHARGAAALVVATFLALALAPGVVAHSELETSVPADGTTLTTPPAEITGDFSEAVDVGRSTMELRGPDGARIAVGKVPDGGDPTRIVIADLPPLGPGAYEVRWTTVTADDDGVERGTFTFTVAAASPTPSPATPAPATPAPATTSAASTPTPAPTTASPAPTPTSGTGAGDLLVPILVLGAVLLGGAALFLRRRR